MLDLIEAGWNGDPNARPSMRDIALHLEVMITTEKEKEKKKLGTSGSSRTRLG